MKTREQMIEAAEVYGRHNLVTLSREITEFLANFALEQIEEAIAAERERIVAALEVEKRIANYGGTNYRSITQKAIDTAIEIVKGGKE